MASVILEHVTDGIRLVLKANPSYLDEVSP